MNNELQTAYENLIITLEQRDEIQEHIIKLLKDKNELLEIKIKNLEKENKESKSENLEKIKKHECECCGIASDDVKFVINPYDQDVNNVEKVEYLCDSCYQNYCDDI